MKVLKLTPQFIVKQRINNRTAEKLKHVKIGNLTNQKDAQFLQENIMPLASFARKNNIGISFTNGKDLFENQTMMNIFEKRTHYNNAEVPVKVQSYRRLASGFTNISESGKNPRDIIETLKAEAMNILSKK